MPRMQGSAFSLFTPFLCVHLHWMRLWVESVGLTSMRKHVCTNGQVGVAKMMKGWKLVSLRKLME